MALLASRESQKMQKFFFWVGAKDDPNVTNGPLNYLHPFQYLTQFVLSYKEILGWAGTVKFLAFLLFVSFSRITLTST